MEKFPWPHFVHEPTKTVYAYIESGYPTTMAFPLKVHEFFPGYKGSLASLSFIQSLQKNEQEKSS